MMPATYNLTIRTGDTETIALTIQNSSGTPIDLAGRTYAAQVRESAESSSILATFSCALVGTGSTGQVNCTLPASTTTGLTPGLAVFDLQETNGTVVTTILAGQCTIVRDVTR